MTRPAASRSEGPDVTITDRPGSREAREATRAANARLRPASERVAGADVDHDQPVGRSHAGRSRVGRLSLPWRPGPPASRRAISSRSGAADPDRRQEIPLVLHGVPRPQLPRTRDPPGVHPRAAGDLVSDPSRVHRSARSAATRADRHESRSRGRIARREGAARARCPQARCWRGATIRSSM